MGCGLGWDLPKEWEMLARDQKVIQIKDTLNNLMNDPKINTRVVQQFLSHLEMQTNKGWRHLFGTTNWDYLLQREVLKLGLTTLPPWLASSHVFHINGTVEHLLDNTNRSPFILVEDPANIRTPSSEADIFFNRMIWQKIFIVVGMSFECDSDRFLLSAINQVGDALPIGESFWIIINPDQNILNLLEHRIKNALPRAKIISFCDTFNDWINLNFPGLNATDVFINN